MVNLITVIPLGLFVFVSFSAVLVKGQLPSYIKKCKFEDEKCFIEQVNYVLANKKTGIPELNLASFEPLDSPTIEISQPNGNVNINLKLFNSKIHGFSDMKLISAKGPHKDIKKPAEFRVRGDKLELTGDYTIDGRVLLLPINGGGAAKLTIKDYEFKMKFDGTTHEKDGKVHGKIRKFVGDIKIGNLHVNFENLFNGNKQLSDTMNEFLNENWLEIWNEVKQSVIKSFTVVFQRIFDNTLEKIPYNELFDE